MNLTAENLPLLDRSDRLEFFDQVEVIETN
jgi:hypothetical protein